jgi:GNAT superfamily N-acetyltransferase
MTIRLARASDASDIARLTEQLGYEVEASTVAARLSRILARSDHQFLVAQLDGHTVGWLHAALAEYVESDAFVVIAGLVVDSRHRGRGIGAGLMAHAEEWAKTQGLSIVRVWSSTGRTRAHRFYQKPGYSLIKTQYSFVKALDAAVQEDLKRFVPRVEE